MLTLNALKSHFMIFHTARMKCINLDVKMGHVVLKQINFTKFLGVIIDDKLNFTHHISYLKNKLSKGMGIIIKARHYLNKKVLITLYNTFIYPYLIYCVEI